MDKQSIDPTLAGNLPEDNNRTPDTEAVHPERIAVSVCCPRPTFRRAGLVFTQGKQTVDVTPEQLARLQAEPCLVVRVLSPTGDDEGGVAGVVHPGTDTPTCDMNTRIRAAVAALEADNPAHFTAAGKPKVAAVVDVLGDKVTQSQIDAALNQDAS
ncbi:HI1506-related protein [Edwardsiella anguillarum]|nr:HI1506-related protein [Edwardsiella anguillarum]KAB0589398.1 hypothetical protein F7P84_14360 [Edwardsiella anguillarum]